MRRFALPAILGTTFLLLANIAPAHAQRTWVSGLGDDTNPCSRTAPCKTFAGAHSKTPANGIINCLDPGGYGAVTITKSITIDCTNTMAGVVASDVNAININGSGINVILRGLDIEGITTGSIGINFIQGASLQVEKCNIYGFKGGTAHGIHFVSTAAAQLFVSDTTISYNGTGIFVDPGAGTALVTLQRVQLNKNNEGFRATGSGSGVIFANIQDSLASMNGTNGFVAFTPAGGAAVTLDIQRSSSNLNGGDGIRAEGALASVFVGTSMVTGNSTGFNQVSGGVIRSYASSAGDTNTAPGSVTPPTVTPF